MWDIIAVTGVTGIEIGETIADVNNPKKIDFVDINVMYNNKIAIKLYESLGFNALSLKMRMKMD